MKNFFWYALCHHLLAFFSSTLADLLGSDVSIFSQKLGSTTAKSKTQTQRKEELKKWRKDHQAKVREKYKQEVEDKRRPEARPFSSDKHVVSVLLGTHNSS